MLNCKFTKKGLMYLKWNPDKQTEDIFPAQHPIIHINHNCEIDEGVNLRDIMNVVASDTELTKVVAIYSEVNHIDEFHEEVNLKFRKKETESDHLEIYRFGQMYKGKLECWVDMHGVNTKETCKMCNDKEWPEHGHYICYSYTPLHKYAMLPVKLNKRYIIRNIGIAPSKNQVVLDTFQDFTLLEVLYSIYYDISFHGGPKDRDKFLKKLNNYRKEVKQVKSKLKE